MPTTSAQHAERHPRIVGLWKSKDPTVWADALARVPAIHAADPRLAAVDAARYAWLQTNPELGAMSKYPDVTERCVGWMLARNNQRPIAHYTEALSQGQITAACRAAAAELGDSPKKQPSLEQVEAASNALTSLRGVGPGTASAILAAVSPSIPFASDELAVAVFDDHHFKTVEEFVDMVRAARKRARELTAAGQVWSARDVERALWAAARDPSFVVPSKKKAGKGESEPATPTGKAAKGAAPATELKTRSGRVSKPPKK